MRACAWGAALGLVAALLAGTATAAEPLRIMLIDPLSGPQGLIGTRVVRQFNHFFARENAAGGVLERPLELVACDSKLSARDARNCLDRAIADGIRFVLQGVGSNVTLTLLDAIEKHNARNPGREVLLLNWAGQDEEMTNEHCSFWQFRTDAHVGMKIAAMTAWLARAPDIRRVYLINQDYSTGQNARRLYREHLARLRPDIVIVGDDLVPPYRVQDWTPYVNRIQQAQPDAVLTTNVGPDLSRLVRAAGDAEVPVRWFTTYGSMVGTIPAVGARGVDRVYQASDTVLNMDGPGFAEFAREMAAAGMELENLRAWRVYRFLVEGLRRAGRAEAAAVAFALEGATLDVFGERVELRREDHQAVMPINISVMSAAVATPQEGTPWSFRVLEWVPAEAAARPSTCRMRRPAG